MGGRQKAQHLLSNDKFQRQEIGERVHALPNISRPVPSYKKAEFLGPRRDIQGFQVP
jgi:hypothetical protein